MRARRVSSLFCWGIVGLSSSSALAEGAAQVGADQNLQATESRLIGTNTLRLGRLGVDILAVGEDVTWVGTGSVRIWAPSVDPDSDPPTATLSSGQTFDATEVGAHTIEVLSDQGATAWDISVSGTAPGYGRLFSESWYFYTGGYGAGEDTDASFYSLVPAGDSDKTGVIELKLDGMSGYEYVIAANQRGVDGAIAGRSVPVAGNGFTPEYRVYVNPPEIATYDPVTPVASAFDFGGGPLGCDQIATGVSSGTFEFESNITGTYHLVCDLNKDSIYNRVGSEDFLYVGLAEPGTNTATWNGLDNTGAPVPNGDYECRVFLNTGEMHYVAWDVETAYRGLRMFEVANDLSRIGLDGFWNDSAIQANSVNLPSGEQGSESSDALGVNAGLYTDPASADGSTTSGNAHAWGNYNGAGDGKGNESLIDTFAFLRSTATGAVNVTILDPAQDTDSDTLPDYVESCEIGTEPDDSDTDGDGIEDGAESGSGVGVDSDGDGVIDALDADSDNDGITDFEEGAADTDGDLILDVHDLDSDSDGIPDIVEQQLGALDLDGDGRIDDAADDDGDGLANVVDADPSDPAVATSIGSTVNTDDLADGSDRVDLDSDEDGLSDVFEGGGLDFNLDGKQDFTAEANNNGLDDAVEPGGAAGPLPIPNADSMGAPDFQQADADGDGVADGTDSNRTDATLCADTDVDSCDDCSTGSFDPSNDGADNDLDGTCNLGDADDDSDGVLDPDDSDDANPLVCVDADGDGCDECNSGMFDSVTEDGADFDGDGICDAGDSDDDNDGSLDVDDSDGNNSTTCADNDGDGCEDCASGSLNPASDGPDFDADGLCDAGDADDDNDGALDEDDSDDQDPNVCSDTDGDTCDDCSNGSLSAGNDGVDSDADGLCDVGEELTGSDPEDVDSDDDGVPDGDEPDGDRDTDGDGLINRNDPDSDNDGLSDGTELGLDCSAADTDADRGFCVADADGGETVTDPLVADTDGGGKNDGSEDSNLDGRVDEGEGDPTSGSADDDSEALDSDGDGLSDALEESLGSDPNDADSDDDGLSDGDEPNPALDMDGDGLIGILDVDSDNDGLFDGTEVGKGCQATGTDATRGHCRADADPDSTTSPLDADSDDGGASDGSEDSNLNGAVDEGETDPESGAGDDDGDVLDSDGDGLGDNLEETLGSDPQDGDSDDDGLPDGDEPNPSDDHDGDGKVNLLDEDSDDDGIFDGTEVGNDCAGEDIDLSKESCIEDADDGVTVTNPLDADSDAGGLLDGVEDSNHNGMVDQGEGDPNDGDDDADCVTDSECGSASSGLVCDAGKCVDGCRGEDGNACPSGEECSSESAEIGVCDPDAGSGEAGLGGAGTGDDSVALTVRGGGLQCAVQSEPGAPRAPLWLLLASLGALAVRRRRAA